MIVQEMQGTHRGTLLRSLTRFLRVTKAVANTVEAAFLPVTDAHNQALRIEEAKSAVPPQDDTVKDFELTTPQNEVCRNAVVVHAKFIDRKVRTPEKEENVSTSESDALMEELQLILRALGDERDLESTINRKRNTEAVEKGDPAQMDLVDDVS